MADEPTLYGAVKPEKCETMAQVREGVDALDKALVKLLALRFGYMRAAARIKDSKDKVRDEPRKAEVIAAVRAQARNMGLPDEAIGDIWDRLIEASIDYESVEWDRLRPDISSS